MQSQDSTNRTAGAMKHPDATEWMAFLYGEVALERKRELETHLAQCADCAAELKNWRSGIAALDEWKLPATRRMAHRALPVLKWAAAAALVLGAGFVFGRQTSPAGAELAELKKSVTQLAETVQRERAVNLTNSANIATAAANTETLRLLSEYSRVQAEQRITDQQAAALALRDFETRLGRLRAELETVALNTENGFEQTHENLTRLASFSAPLPSGTDSSRPDLK
jgi:anti-sigma factor RsiW